MKKIVKNSKLQLFKKTWTSANDDFKSANVKALKSGEILSQLKIENKGRWAKFVETELDGIIKLDQADNLIRCFEERHLVNVVSGDGALTIKRMLRIISEATPEQIAEAEELKAKQAEADKREAYRKELLAKDAEAKKAKAANAEVR